MTADRLKALTLEGFERMFNNGDLDHVERGVAPGAVDHQEPEGTDFVAHLTEVIVTLRTAFPDLRFEVHEILAEGPIVVPLDDDRHPSGTVEIERMAGLPMTGARIEVPTCTSSATTAGSLHRPVARLEHALPCTSTEAPGPDLRIGATP